MPRCLDCKPVSHAQMMTEAKCGHPATRVGMELCERCSLQKDACEACGEQLNPDPPPHTD